MSREHDELDWCPFGMSGVARCEADKVLKAEITKLREERARLRELVGDLWSDGMTLGTAHRLKAENTKLREMVRDMFEEIDMYGLDAMYEEDPSWKVRIRELGIEVDA